MHVFVRLRPVIDEDVPVDLRRPFSMFVRRDAADAVLATLLDHWNTAQGARKDRNEQHSMALVVFNQNLILHLGEKIPPIRATYFRRGLPATEILFGTARATRLRPGPVLVSAVRHFAAKVVFAAAAGEIMLDVMDGGSPL